MCHFAFRDFALPETRDCRVAKVTFSSLSKPVNQTVRNACANLMPAAADCEAMTDVQPTGQLSVAATIPAAPFPRKAR